MDLTPEEEEIIRRYRKESASKKKAILANLNAFKNWLKNAVKWVWEKIVDLALQHIVDTLFYYLKQQFFES